MKNIATALRFAAALMITAGLLLGSFAVASAREDDSGIKGLWLVVTNFPENSAFVELAGPNAKGEVAYARSLDGMLTLTVKREKAAEEYGIEAIRKDIAKTKGVNPGSVTVTQDDTLSEKFSYPVFLAQYTTGKDKDAMAHYAFVLYTDSYTFRILVDANAAYAAGRTAEHFDAKKIDAWFAGVEFREDNEPDEQREARDFAEAIQNLVAEDQREDLAGLIRYPLKVDGKPKVKDAKAFVKAYDAIVTEAVKECLSGHDASEEVDQSRGNYLIGWGCIWFGPDEDGDMRIISINTKE